MNFRDVSDCLSDVRQNNLINASDFVSLNELLNELDRLIRSDPSVRQSLPESFYEIFLEKIKLVLDKLLKTGSNNESKAIDKVNQQESTIDVNETSSWSTLSLMLKCVKNSAAILRIDRFDKSENDLCQYLSDYLNSNIRHSIFFRGQLSTTGSSTSPEHLFHLYLFQYICNLIQGNEKASEKYALKWSSICLDLLAQVNLKQDFADITSMVLIFVREKTNHSTILESGAEKIKLDSYLSWLKEFDETLREKNLKLADIDSSSMHQWSFKLIEFYFRPVYLNLIVDAKFSLYNNKCAIKTRLLFYRLLNIKQQDFIDDLKSQNRKLDNDSELEYFKRDSISHLIDEYSKSCIDLNNSIEEIDRLNDLEQLADRLDEIRLLAECTADLLTADEYLVSSDLVRDNITLAQNKFIDFFKPTCQLYKEINTNDSLKTKLNTIADAKYAKSLNIKCELVRLIGILVYENERNQSFIVESGLLNIISNNLDIDMDNPFIREWSTIALKHILNAHDRK